MWGHPLGIFSCAEWTSKCTNSDHSSCFACPFRLPPLTLLINSYRSFVIIRLCLSNYQYFRFLKDNTVCSFMNEISFTYFVEYVFYKQWEGFKVVLIYSVLKAYLHEPKSKTLNENNVCSINLLSVAIPSYIREPFPHSCRLHGDMGCAEK